LDRNGLAMLIRRPVGDGRLDVADDPRLKQALLEFLAARLVGPVYLGNKRLLSRPVTLQSIDDHVVLLGEAARENLIVNVTLQMLGSLDGHAVGSLWPPV
jgi:hypothetical protein